MGRGAGRGPAKMTSPSRQEGSEERELGAEGGVIWVKGREPDVLFPLNHVISGV